MSIELYNGQVKLRVLLIAIFPSDSAIYSDILHLNQINKFRFFNLKNFSVIDIRRCDLQTFLSANKCINADFNNNQVLCHDGGSLERLPVLTLQNQVVRNNRSLVYSTGHQKFLVVNAFGEYRDATPSDIAAWRKNSPDAFYNI